MSRPVILDRGRQLIGLFDDREYFSRLVRIGLPIALQQFVMSSLNWISMALIGQLGDESVAAVGLGNQIYFLFNLLIFGISSGSAMFTAQLWGKQDVPNIRRVLSLCLLLGGAASLLFMGISIFAPEQALGIYSEDPKVIALGSEYLRIFGWSFLFTGVTFSFAGVLRSTGDVKTPLVNSLVALSFSTLLSYGLVLGNFGLPALGVRGAAYAILVARILECLALLAITYLRRSPAAVSLADVASLSFAFARKILVPILPVVLNEVFWSLGVTTYSVVYAHIDTDAIAAMNIVSTIDSVATVVFMGIAHACAVLVGNWIGANDFRQAHRYAGRSLTLCMAGGVLMGGLILIVSPWVLSLYKVSPQALFNARNVLLIVAGFMWIRAANMTLFIGVFRSGGDTRFAFMLDAVIIWVLGVPLAVMGAFLFHLPVYWVYLLVMAEEVAKFTLGMYRYFSRKWIHNLALGV